MHTEYVPIYYEHRRKIEPAKLFLESHGTTQTVTASTHTHPYEYTYANPTPMSTFEGPSTD
jgi:hypothetical protein